MIPLIIYSLAAWRIASMIVEETGPGDVFLKLRARVGITHDTSKRVVMVPDGFFPGVFSCVWCCSVWVGMFWVLFDVLFPWVALRMGTAFAISTLAILIQCLVERRS